MRKLGRFFTGALAMREQMLGSDHPDTAASLNNLAFVLRHLGDLAGARPLFDQGEGAQPRHSDTHLPCETLLRTCSRIG